MKIVFFGTPDYVVPLLDKLHKTFKSRGGSPITAVVTQKPKPTGRKQVLEYSPVDNWAHKKKVSAYYKAVSVVEKNVKADFGILAAYGEIVPKKVIDHFAYGILNIHPSLLPKYRGASPVQAAILLGEKQAGVTITKMDEKLDMGQKISQFTKEIFDNDTSGTLRSRLFKDVTEVLTTLLPAYVQGKIKMEPLGHEEGTFTTLIKKADGFIPPKYIRATLQGGTFKGMWKIAFIKNYSIEPGAEVIERFIRAMQPWPISWTHIQLNPKQKTKDLKRLKILKSHTEEKSKVKGSSFAKASVDRQKLNVLVLDQVQLEGKNPVSWEQFKEGYPEAIFLKT